MGIIGKIVGGTLGFAIGGPLGAIFGAAFGHVFDKSESISHDQLVHLSSGEEAQVTFFIAVFSMLGKLAKADGNISKEEIDSVEKLMLFDLNLSPASRKASMDVFYAAAESQETFQDFALQFYNHFKFQPQMLEFMIDILLKVSIADGHLSKNEEELILLASRTFNFSQTEYQQFKSKYIKNIDKYYAILGCGPDDSFDLIKKKYRQLVTEYHPDKIASKGLPDEFLKFANDKFIEIQEAYESIKTEKGIN